MKADIGRKEILWIVSFSVVVAVFYQAWFSWENVWGDEVRYIRQSESPFITISPPWSYRILSPMIAALIPLPIDWGYRTLTFLGASGILVSVYLLARNMGCSPIFSICIWILYIVHPQMRYFAEHCALVDPLTTLFLVTFCSSLVLENERRLSTSLLLGVLNHEAILWALPVFFIHDLLKRFHGIMLVRPFILALPSLFAFILTRFVFPQFNDDFIHQELLRTYYPSFSKSNGFLDYFINYFFIHAPSGRPGWNMFVGMEFTGEIATLIPLAVIGFFLSNRPLKSLLFFWASFTAVTVVMQARAQLLYLTFPVVVVYLAIVFRSLSDSPFLIQGLLAAITLSCLAFYPNSWIAGFLLAGIYGWTLWRRPAKTNDDCG